MGRWQWVRWFVMFRERATSEKQSFRLLIVVGDTDAASLAMAPILWMAVYSYTASRTDRHAAGGMRRFDRWKCAASRFAHCFTRCDKPAYTSAHPHPRPGQTTSMADACCACSTRPHVTGLFAAEQRPCLDVRAHRLWRDGLGVARPRRILASGFHGAGWEHCDLLHDDARRPRSRDGGSPDGFGGRRDRSNTALSDARHP